VATGSRSGYAAPCWSGVATRGFPRDRAAGARGGRCLESRRILVKIGALFGLDGWGGSHQRAALLLFFERFGVGPGTVARCSSRRVLNAFSHLGGPAGEAHRAREHMVGRTRPRAAAQTVGTSELPVAAALFLLREGPVEMDAHAGLECRRRVR
jgi:hypothetical protein